MYWQTSRFQIDLTTPKIMGILNVTPDSFSDGGEHYTVSQALTHAEKMLKDGADILDIGAESTRPGTLQIPLDEELRRLKPILQELIKFNVPLSVDTYKPEMMQIALDMGVDIINDVWCARMPGAIEVLSSHAQCGICIMHMHGEPQSMHLHPMVGDVTAEVKAFLQQQADQLQKAGVQKEQIVIDYGIGFGKTVVQNFELLANQGMLIDLGFPLLAAWSRKKSLGAVTGREVYERMPASITVAALAVEHGASLVRVHDVKETVDALAVLRAMRAVKV